MKTTALLSVPTVQGLFTQNETCKDMWILCMKVKNPSNVAYVRSLMIHEKTQWLHAGCVMQATNVPLKEKGDPELFMHSKVTYHLIRA